jgi:hypothetical protein
MEGQKGDGEGDRREEDEFFHNLGKFTRFLGEFSLFFEEICPFLVKFFSFFGEIFYGTGFHGFWEHF